MDEEIDTAIHLVISTITRTTPADAVLKITQSALNLANVKSILVGLQEEAPRPRRGRPPKVAVDEA